MKTGMTVEQLLTKLLDYGLPTIGLALVLYALFRMGKWAAGILENALLDPNNGWLAVTNRNSEALQRNVTNTERYLSETAKRDAMQQELCERHAENLEQVSTVLKGHLELSTDTLTSLEKLREEHGDPDSPFSTVKTNEKLDRVVNGICHACDAIIEVTRDAGVERADIVQNHCMRIKELLRGN